MSLTGFLKQPENPFRQFMEEHFPNIAPVRQEVNTKLQGKPTIRPRGQIPWGNIGRAIDYRIRYYFNVTPSQELWAYKAIKKLSGSAVPMKLAREFFQALDEEIIESNPTRMVLGEEEERILNRYCLILALFEEVARMGDVDRVKGYSPLFRERRKSVADLLAIPESNWLDDLTAMSRLFHERFEHLTEKSHILNPEFEGTPDVLGADADLIVDNCLIDIKSQVNPTNNFKLNLYQLLGYVLLDYSNHYQLGSVGFYWARQGVLTTWELESLLNNISSQSTADLEEQRKAFQDTARDYMLRLRFGY